MFCKRCPSLNALNILFVAFWIQVTCSLQCSYSHQSFLCFCMHTPRVPTKAKSPKTGYTFITWMVSLTHHSIEHQGIYPLSGKSLTSNLVKSQASRLGVTMVIMLCNLRDISAALFRGACCISVQLKKLKPKSLGFETSRNPVVRRPSA